MSTKRKPRLCRVPTVFRTWWHQVGAKAEGFRLPLRGGACTPPSLNGVRALNEVETSPRHHAQRRAPLVYLPAVTSSRGISGQGSCNLAPSRTRRGDRIQELAQGAQPCAGVLVGQGVLVPQAEQLVGDIEGGESQELHGVLGRARALDLSCSLLDMSGQLAD